MFMHRSVVVSCGIALLLSACDQGGGPMRAESSSPARAAPPDEESLEDTPDDEEGEDSDAGEPPTPASEEPDALGLPCDVKAVFAGHCQGCHTADAKNGTPLMTRDDLLAASRKEPGMTVLERALARATASDKPMPPVGKGMALSEEQLSVIRAWADDGSQAGRCDE